MTFRSIVIVVAGVAGVLGTAAAAPSGTPSPKVEAAVLSETGLPAYRSYVTKQASILVGMTRALSNAIRRGDLEAAQLSYAPAHRYFARLVPIASAMRDLDKSMDARADAYVKKEADPDFSGFHRIEYGLFAAKSTAGLLDVADRLEKDTKALRDRLVLLGVTPTMVVDGTVRNLEMIVDTGLRGAAERYSQTDLWDIEANIESARQVVAMVRTESRGAKHLASTDAHFAVIAALLEKHKVGCGFKNFDELRRDDRTALKAPIMALAAELASLRGTLAMD